MRFAYADPPYLGCSKRHYADHPEHAIYDTIDGHRLLIETLVSDFPDGWAYSCTSGNLREILPLCPASARVAAWVKPFASFKPGVNPAYAWEPVIFCGGRKMDRDADTVRDWVSANITMRKGVHGAKPVDFCWWLFNLMGMSPEDELVDIFPGSGAVSKSFEAWRITQRLI